MYQPSFAVKATAGMLLAALAPVYCVWFLSDQQKKGTIMKPSRRAIERAGTVSDLMRLPREEQ